MKHKNQPLPVRLAALELLANETGFVDELETRQREEIDKRRATLAAKLNALPNRDRELVALAKDAAHARAAHEKAATEHREAERRDKEATVRLVTTTMAIEGERQAILTELERYAPPELAEALDDLSFANTLLRSAIRTDVAAARNWLGHLVHTVDSNLDAIASARKAIAKGEQAIRELAKDGVMSSGEMAARSSEILEAALEPAFEFIPRKLWDLRYDKPGSDIAAEVRDYMQ